MHSTRTQQRRLADAGSSSALSSPSGWVLTVVGFFAAYGLVVFLPVLIGSRALFWHDVSIAYLPLRTAAADAISRGHLPLWESRMGNGFPVLAEGQAGVFYPLHVIGYIGLPQYQAYAILVWLHCLLAGVFTALYCRAMRLSLGPCLMAGLVYGWSGFFITHVLHITMLEAAAWLPLTLLCIEMWLREPHRKLWLALGAITLALQELVAMPQIFFYSVLTCALYFAAGLLCRAETCAALGRTPGRRALRMSGAAAVVFVGAGLIAAVQAIPTKFLVSASERSEVTSETLRELALTPRNLAYFIHPYILGSYEEGNYFGRDHYYEVCGFAGTLTLLLAVVGAAYSTGRARLFATLLVPLALFMALAHQNPLYELFPSIPGFSWFRGAGRYVLLSSLGLAILSAYGLQSIIASRRAGKTCMWLAIFGLVLCVVVPLAFRAGEHQIVPRLKAMVDVNPERDTTPLEEAQGKYEFLCSRLSLSDPTFLLIVLSLAAGAAAGGWRLAATPNGRVVSAGVVGVVAVQLLVFASGYNPAIDTRYYTERPRLAPALDAAPDTCVFVHAQNELETSMPGERGWRAGDFEFYFREREFLRPNRQVLYNLRAAGVFYALVPDRTWQVLRALDESLGVAGGPRGEAPLARPAEVLRAMGVGVVCTATVGQQAGLLPLGEFGSWRALRLPDPLPLAYFAEGVVLCSSVEDAWERLRSERFCAERPVVEVPAGQTTRLAHGPERPRVLGVENDCGRITIRCVAKGHEFLVVREVFDEHFRCSVDGVPAPIRRTNFLFRGVEIGPGEHTVEFRYDAGDLRIGLCLSLVSLIALLAWAGAGRRR